MSGIDFIGDTHGQAERHETLLRVMDYEKVPGKHLYRHPDARMVIYLGDAINRGGQQRSNLAIHRTMVEEADAQMAMGNHEFKAIAYARKFNDGYLRSHSDEHVAEHAIFLYEFPLGSSQHRDAIRFFETLPIYIRTKSFNAVHAFWSAAAIKTIQPHLHKKTHTLKESAYNLYGRQKEQPDKPEGPFKKSLDLLLKGPSFQLPPGVTVTKTSGEIKDETRIFWWLKDEDPLATLADHGDQFVNQLESKDVQDFYAFKNQFRYASQRPLFIGHYNLQTEAEVGASSVACLNYKDKICAYRWNEGDKSLDSAKLVCV